MAKAELDLRGRNPDVLSCIASLSNDEVFTPPDLANQMLDTIAAAWATTNDGENVWSNSSVTFLDPCTKTGVFLREVTKRLIAGLASEIPDLATRVDHILTRQVFGVAITELTNLLSRRTLYCSKFADGPHSVVKSFRDAEGNIRFTRTEHSWVRATCSFCGASRDVLGRDAALETHAYALIHARDAKAQVGEWFGGDMRFDVIIGNPPYQLSDGGFGASAAPIYQMFVEQAKRLEPRYLSMIIPARWFTGGKGLDEFRAAMLGDRKIRAIHDYLDSSDAFPGVELQGGVCYFLWDADNPGDCLVTTYYDGQSFSSAMRPLLEPGAATFIRHNDAVSIVRKVIATERGDASGLLTLPEAKQFMNMVSPRKPFGLPTDVRGKQTPFPASVKIFQFGGSGFIGGEAITSSRDVIGKWKIFIGGAHGGQGHGRDVYPTMVLGKPFVGEPGTACTETYLYIGPCDSGTEARNIRSYISTRLFRLLVLLNKSAQHATRRVYALVPMQDFTKPWTDHDLYTKYGLTDEEIAFVEAMVRPMELNDD